MNACLNPFERHFSPENAAPELLCPEPGCGFLLAGAAFGTWQITTLLRHAEATDVYLAEPRESAGAHMLVKILKRCAHGSLMRLERLLALQHPYIHQIQSAGWMSEAQAIYLLSRYEALGSLARLLEAGGQISFSQRLSMILQIAHALHYAHERGIIHGHIKLENCLVATPDAIQLCDFYHTLLGHDLLSMQPPYLAPEQRYGKPLPASDQYALAMLVCRLLSRQSASFDQEQGFSASIQSVPRFVADALAAAPASLQQVLMRALAPQAPARFPGVLDFAFALQQAAGMSSSGGSLPLAQAALPSARLSPARTLDNAAATTASPLLPPKGITTLSRLPGHTEAVTLVRWAPDGKLLASAGPDHSIRLWYIQQRVGTPLATLTENKSAVTALCWPEDGRFLASAAADGTIRIWSVSRASTSEVRPFTSWWGHDGRVTALDWSQQGQLASGGKDRMVRLWDQQGNSLSAWQVPARGGVTAVAWSPASSLLAAGSSDGVIYLWDATSGTLIGSYAGHSDEVRHLCWSADGRLLASSASKKNLNVYLWDTKTGQRVADLQGHTREITSIFWPRAASWLATLAADHTLRCWDIGRLPAEPLGPPISLEIAPLAADKAPGKNIIALGAADMQVHILQWSL